MTGLEPAASFLQGKRSAKLSYTGKEYDHTKGNPQRFPLSIIRKSPRWPGRLKYRRTFR